MTTKKNLREHLETDVAGFAGSSGKEYLEIYDRIDLEADAPTAWNAFKTFGVIDGWHPATLNCRLILGEEGVPGAVREFEIQGGGYVISELLSYDEIRQHFRYRILKTNLPLHGYVGEMWVTAADPRRCTVHWKGSFRRPLGAGEDQDQPTRELVQQVFMSGFAGIQSRVADPARSA